MRLTVVGCGDAFGSGGRFNTCFHIVSGGGTVLLDCGASSLVALRACGISPASVDGVILSHLHGDHFAGLPFLLLDAQFLTRRTRPLLIAGPPGTRERIDAALEVLFPKSTKMAWRFSWEVTELAVDVPAEALGFRVHSRQVMHRSGDPSTALRLTDGGVTLAYSGDTEWTDRLIPVADGADLFICECYGHEGHINGHLSWETLQPHLGELRAKRIMLTHMNEHMLTRTDAARAAGLMIAEDGLVIDL